MDANARHEAVIATMKLAPVIPVLTVRDVADGLAQARALVAGGLSAIEVTLRTPAALAAIAPELDADVAQLDADAKAAQVAAS